LIIFDNFGSNKIQKLGICKFQIIFENFLNLNSKKFMLLFYFKIIS